MDATRDLIFTIVGTAIITTRIIAELIARAKGREQVTHSQPHCELGAASASARTRRPAGESGSTG